MPSDKIIYLIFFVISIAIVSVVAHVEDSKSLASAEHRIQNTNDTLRVGTENETSVILFMLQSPEGDVDDKTNDGA